MWLVCEWWQNVNRWLNYLFIFWSNNRVILSLFMYTRSHLSFRGGIRLERLVPSELLLECRVNSPTVDQTHSTEVSSKSLHTPPFPHILTCTQIYKCNAGLPWWIPVNLWLLTWDSLHGYLGGWRQRNCIFFFFFMVSCLMKFIQYKILRARVILEAKLIFFIMQQKWCLKWIEIR